MDNNNGVSTGEATFVHTVTAWTVGDLRRALAHVPDDVQLVCVTAEEPGGKTAGDTQVICGGGYAQEWVPPERVDGVRVDGHWTDPNTTYQLELEFPSGTYYRPKD